MTRIATQGHADMAARAGGRRSAQDLRDSSVHDPSCRLARPILPRALRRSFAGILCLFLLAGTAYAGSKDLLRPTGIEASLALAWFDYEEPGLMEEYGVLPGIGIRALVRPSASNFVFDAQADAFSGVLTYDGQYQDGTPLEADTYDFVGEGRGLIGYDLLGAGWRVTPYLGLGYRYWYDEVQDSGGYGREIRYFYAPLGLETAKIVDTDTALGLRGEYDLFIRGWVTSHLSDVSSAWDDAENDQDFGSGYGLRGSAFLSRRVWRDKLLTWEAFVRYWRVQDSDKTVINGPDDPSTPYVERRYIVWEPANRTTMFGLRVGLTF